jgi:hypothetical protein
LLPTASSFLITILSGWEGGGCTWPGGDAQGGEGGCTCILCIPPRYATGDSPTPSHACGSVSPPPLVGGWGVHARLRERGWGDSNSDKETNTVVLWVRIYALCDSSSPSVYCSVCQYRINIEVCNACIILNLNLGRPKLYGQGWM